VAHRSERTPTLFPTNDQVAAGVDHGSSPQEKVALYRSLFAGRSDVYALRWENSTNGKSGWSPAKSGRSASSRYLLLDDEVIRSHLAGRVTAGVYPLIDGDKCWFLACDFDKGSWTMDALAFLGVCTEVGVPAVLERSRSGNGAHVWIFFEQPVAASTARRLGTGLLRETMAVRAEVDLGSYDRLFPSQDFVPQKGFGNLIAFPLQGQCRKAGTTVFLDPTTMEPWEDQWAFLASIRRLSASDAKTIGDAIRVDAGPGSASWPPSSRTRPGPPAPAQVAATLGAALAIDRIGLPPALMASLKHLGSVHNPEFHRRQQLRLSTWNTPRMVRRYEEDIDRLYLPRGLIDDAAKILAAAGSQMVLEDHRPTGPAQDFTFTGTLTADQEVAVTALAAHELGVLVAPTGAGKTVMACALIARLATPTLILVHTKPLAEQWRQRLGTFLGLSRRQIGQLGAGRARTGGIIDLATPQTLARRDNPAEVFAGYGLVIVDECHHLPAVSFEKAVREAANRRWIGLTATPRRRDGLEAILHMQLGPIRHTMTPDPVAPVMVRRDLIVHDTLTDPDTDEQAAVQVVLGQVATDLQRNEQICADVADAHRRGRNVLVFTDRTEHLEQIRVGLTHHHLDPVVLQGGTPKKTRVAIIEALHAATDPILLLATGAYLGEGFDLPALDTLFLAFPISGPNRVTQYAGRVTRPLAAKTSIEIHDYHDILHPLTRRMHQRRLAAFKTLGFTATQGVQHPTRPEQSYGGPGLSTKTLKSPNGGAAIPSDTSRNSSGTESPHTADVTANAETPSRVNDEYWIYATDPGQPLVEEDPATTTVGKWQLFVPRQKVDDAWALVAKLVRRGQLDRTAKVATARDNPNNPGAEDMHVIIVYANDWRDTADVRRILKTLRQEGLAKGWVHFKRDRETLAGAYGVRGHRGVSVWNARPGEHDEISTKWTTGKPVPVTEGNSAEIVAAIEMLDQANPP
jgi:superfamily II DNA or RNA helicase